MVDGPGLQIGRQPLAIVVVNLHIKTAGTSGQDAPYPSHAQDSQALAGQLDAQAAGRAPVRPGCGADLLFARMRPPGSGDQQQHGDLCRRIIEYIRSVGNQDTARSGGIQIDVVIADRKTADGADTLWQAFNDRCVQLLCVTGNDGIGPSGVCNQLIAAVDPILPIEPRIVITRQARFDGVW